MLNIQSLTAFFKWCSIINIGLFAVSVIMILAASDFIYAMHGPWFHLPREAFDVTIYALMGAYKIVILVFNLVPYVALRMIDDRT